MEYMNHTKSITKAQLIEELKIFADEIEIFINIGKKDYPIDCVISGSGKIHLESNIQLGRPEKYKSDEARRAARLEQFRKSNEKRRAKK